MNHKYCKAIGCFQEPAEPYVDYCEKCTQYVLDLAAQSGIPALPKLDLPREMVEKMSDRYPKYYKSVGDLKEVDVYAVHMLFQVDDPSGALQHASKKLLLSGCRTGGKSAFDDVREARDTLNRWLELNTSQAVPTLE